MKPFEQRGHAILKRLPKNAVVAEIGVLMGVLSEYLLSRRPDIKIFMVDNWQTADKQPAAYKATGDDHALHADPARVASHRSQAESRAKRFAGRAIIVPVSSIEAATTIADGSLDLVFLDADHSYDAVRADLSAWLPKVKAGGWIGGHDFENPDPRFRFGVCQAVDEWADAAGRVIETDLNYTWFARV
ncbi:class I SAM-dependent methyltransferase [Neorhizobium sp. Rsf11]|uniref:Class I SAM-dependent methyltransferase n=1 Tax=Neorhizobium phenanthreniclasticum TaxID=3157917 RepID=A0ABV0LW66_9HYPH